MRVDDAREVSRLTVALIDVDGFKVYNDTHGHLAGDMLLASLAEVWSGLLEEGQCLGRLGGDEFVLLLPGTTQEAGIAVAERLRAAVPRPQTASVGVAQRLPGEAASALLERADQALYAAKRAGRNKVSAAPDS